MSGMSGQELQARLQELAREVEQCQSPLNLEAALCERFRRYHRGRRTRQILAIGSIAACLMLVFVGGTVLVRRSLPTAIPAPEPRPRAAIPVNRTLQPQPGLVEVAPNRLRTRVAKRKPSAAPRAEIEQEVMTSFIPVGVGAAFGLGERGSLVRVRLPRSALATFGLPINQSRVSDVVNADVLLGEDGLARAIRFVQ
jgi:hypothetical protein